MVFRRVHSHLHPNCPCPPAAYSLSSVRGLRAKACELTPLGGPTRVPWSAMSSISARFFCLSDSFCGKWVHSSAHLSWSFLVRIYIQQTWGLSCAVSNRQELFTFISSDQSVLCLVSTLYILSFIVFPRSRGYFPAVPAEDLPVSPDAFAC